MSERRDGDADPTRSDSADPRVAGAPSAVADAEFALLLTHDVDRPYKSVQALYHAVRHRDPSQLADLLPGRNPWWQFDEIRDLEASLGVRSAFYVLREPHLFDRPASDWLDPFYWIEHAGRYDPSAPELADALVELDDAGWEVGLHGSYDSYDDRDRLRTEKRLLEAAFGREVRGGRQHHLNRAPETWTHHRAVGLEYDATPGSSDTYGFEHGYLPLRPFDDAFVVFPLTVMEAALPDPGTDFEAAWAACERLLAEAADNDAVMTALWHPRLFDERDFPGYRRLYRRLVERALDAGAWVGPPADYYDLLDHPDADGAGASPVREDEGATASGRDLVDDAVSMPADETATRGRADVRASQAEDNKVRSRPNTEPTG